MAETVNAKLLELVERAEFSATAKSTNKRNRALLLEMSFTIVALAQRIAELQARVEEKPRIVCP